MRLIQAVKIENFRSIRNLHLENIESYTPIIGLNSSGKSNFLRALNLFFNSTIDDRHTNLDMTRDLSSYAPQGKKKIVTVGVELNLEGDFNVRQPGQDFLRENKLSSKIAIQRTWAIAPQGQGVIDTFSFGPSLDQLHLAEQGQLANLSLFVRAVSYRYIPNHARPADLIQQYAQPLRGEIVRRLQNTQAYKPDDVEILMLALSKMGEQMFSEVSQSVGAGIKSLSVNPALPTDFAELAFDVAIQSVSNGFGRSPEFEGSGTQAFILLHFLNLIDRVSRGRSFGWEQASVWAIEEPESFLHSGLRTRFADDLYRYAEDPRRQVFVTTHHDEFVRIASTAWLASHAAGTGTGTSNTGTQVKQESPKEALTKSARLAITTYRHPILEYPDTPMVIVEGTFDDVHISAALKEGGIRPRWRLAAPDDIFGEGTAGDSLLQYLKYNRAAIASRPSVAPILVLRDWEDPKKNIEMYRKVLVDHGYSDAVAAPSNLVNPRLGDSFVGVERYLPEDLILAAADASALYHYKGGDDALQIKGVELKAIKKKLATAVTGGAKVGQHAIDLAKWIDGEVTRLLSQVPVEDFLS